jgi:hypothetical protein
MANDDAHAVSGGDHDATASKLEVDLTLVLGCELHSELPGQTAARECYRPAEYLVRLLRECLNHSHTNLIPVCAPCAWDTLAYATSEEGRRGIAAFYCPHDNYPVHYRRLIHL